MIEGFSRPLILTPPKNHRILVQCPTKEGLYIITILNNDRSKYYLFLQEGNNWQKIMHGSREKVEEKVFKKR